MNIGLIGRGPWADVYAKTLRGMGIPFWQASHDWGRMPIPSAAIVACAPQAHYEVAKRLFVRKIPVLVEKPVCMTSNEAHRLLDLARFVGGIGFSGHTRLYSPEWTELKNSIGGEEITSIHAQAGGASKLPWLMDWGPHLIAMCLDLGFHPSKAVFHESVERIPLKLIVNGEHEFTDKLTTPTPLEALISEFVLAVKAGKPDVRGLELGVDVMREIERRATMDKLSGVANGA